MKSFVLVAVGGTIGTMARHGVGEAIGDGRLFPLATFLVNITGSFALGALLAALAARHDSGPRRLLLGTGLLGGYTTYSALAVETQTLVRDGHEPLALAYAGGSVAAGLLAAAVGVLVGRTFAR